MDTIVIGQVINVRGIRGELKVKPLTSDINRYKKLKLVYIENKAYRISGMIIDNKCVYMRLTDITSREQAEQLKNAFVHIDKIHAVPLDEDEYFVADLIGMDMILEEDTRIGLIEDILQYGAADVIVVSLPDGKKAMVPFLSRLTRRVDLNEKKFYVFRDVLQEVAVYED